MNSKALLTFAAFFSLSAFAAQPQTPFDEVTVCIPKGRSEFLTFVTHAGNDHGYFAKKNLKIKIVEAQRIKTESWKVEGGKITRPEFLDYKVANTVGQKDSPCVIGASTVERFLADSEAQKTVRPLFVSNFGDQYDTHLLIPKNSKLKTTKDLRGKNVRIGQLPTYIAMLGLLESNGMKLSDLKVEYGLAGNEKLAALQDGRMDATTAYLPGMAYLLATNRVSVLEPNIVSRFVGKRVPHSLMIVNSAYADKNPEVMLRFKAALLEGYEHLMRNPSEIFHTYLKHKNRESDLSMSSKADIEKATSFVGRVALIDLTKESAERDQSVCDMKNYGNILVTRGYLNQQADLSTWIGVKAEKTKACPPASQNTVASKDSV